MLYIQNIQVRQKNNRKLLWQGKKELHDIYQIYNMYNQLHWPSENVWISWALRVKSNIKCVNM